MKKLLALILIMGSLAAPHHTVDATHDVGAPLPRVMKFDTDAGFWQASGQRPRTPISVGSLPTASQEWLSNTLWPISHAAGWYLFSMTGSVNTGQIQWRVDTNNVCGSAIHCAVPLPWPPFGSGSNWFTSCTIYYTSGSLGPADGAHEVMHCLGFVDNPQNFQLAAFTNAHGPNVHQCDMPSQPRYSAYSGIMSNCVARTIPLGAQDRSSLQYAGYRPWDCQFGVDPFPCDH